MMRYLLLKGSSLRLTHVLRCWKKKAGYIRQEIAMDELDRSGGPRNVAVYSLSSLQGNDLEEIGRQFTVR